MEFSVGNDAFRDVKDVKVDIVEFSATNDFTDDFDAVIVEFSICIDLFTDNVDAFIVEFFVGNDVFTYDVEVVFVKPSAGNNEFTVTVE